MLGQCGSSGSVGAELLCHFVVLSPWRSDDHVLERRAVCGIILCQCVRVDRFQCVLAACACVKSDLEYLGIDPSTSRMLSERSTI